MKRHSPGSSSRSRRGFATANARALIEGRRDAQGRRALEYDYGGKTWGDFGAHGRPNKWVTLRALRAQRSCPA